MFITHEGQDPVNMSLVVEIEPDTLGAFGAYGKYRYNIKFKALEVDSNGDRIILDSWIFNDRVERDKVLESIKSKFFIAV